ncbi:MAG: ketopantoate reductase family protein [Caldilineaceae bacterium]
MNFLIIGAGAIGCLVGGKLAQHGYAVTLVGRPRFAQVVREQGLILRDGQGSHTIRNLTVAGSLAEAFAQADHAYDLAVFTVKSYDTAQALSELTQAIQTAGVKLPVALSLQNGVGNEEALAAVFEDAKVIAGSISTPVSVPQPGVIQIDKAQYRVGLCPWQATGATAPTDAVQQALQKAGFTVTRYPEARGLKWTKLLMNIVGNATSAILNEAPREIFGDAQLLDVEIAALREALAVMGSAGINPVNFAKYPFKWLAPVIRYAPKGLIRKALRAQSGARGDKMPSLQIDLSAGKKQNEVSWLNGAVVRLGQAQSVRTPVNQLLTETVLTLVQQPEQRTGWQHNHARLLEEVEAYRKRAKG